jgi:hypothetical protein
MKNLSAIQEMFAQVTDEYLEGYQAFFHHKRRHCDYCGYKETEFYRGWDEANDKFIVEQSSLCI